MSSGTRCSFTNTHDGPIPWPRRRSRFRSSLGPTVVWRRNPGPAAWRMALLRDFPVSPVAPLGPAVLGLDPIIPGEGTVGRKVVEVQIARKLRTDQLLKYLARARRSKVKNAERRGRDAPYPCPIDLRQPIDANRRGPKIGPLSSGLSGT